LAKEGIAGVRGIVEELLPNATFRVKLIANDHIIIAHTAGKMRKNRIRVLTGDKVMIEMTPTIDKGRITYRSVKALLVLASESPRRAALLAQAGITPDVISARRH